jgi:hypothetical protein
MAKIQEKWLDFNIPTSSSGDINETSFSASNNQSTPVNVTGLSFANGTVRSFNALVSVEIDATTDLFEVFELHGVQGASDWYLSVRKSGDETDFEFSITSSGQVQYVSPNVTGFTSATIRFRADTTSV